jgi:hypothetical protein
MIYEKKTYDLIGKVINVYHERPDLKVIEGKIVDENGNKPVTGPISTLTAVKPKDGELMAKHFHTYLPFFADVTQDLPTSSLKVGLIPETYKNCQLLAETHGAYLQFFDWKTREIHRIAMNSNTYTPVK